MAPLMKAWKTALKEEGAVDFSGLIHQAVNILEKGRFVSPWKHILVDEFQDISPSVHCCFLPCVNLTNIPVCLLWGTTGRRFTVSAVRSCP